MNVLYDPNAPKDADGLNNHDRAMQGKQYRERYERYLERARRGDLDVIRNITYAPATFRVR